MNNEQSADTHSAAYYGNLARVAADFYVTTGKQAELDAAYWYARYAYREACPLTVDEMTAQALADYL